MNTPAEQQKSLIDRGFELSKGIDKAMIIGGVGAAAVGAVIAAPAVVAFGAIVAGGSIASIEITNRIDAYRREKRAKQTAKVGKTAAQHEFTLAA